MQQHLVRLILMGFLCLAQNAIASAATYYVAKTGSDSYSCAQAQSAVTSKLTLLGGIGCLSSGDTLIIKEGTYSETLEYPPVNLPSGTTAQPTTIKVHGGDLVTINGAGHYILNIQNKSDIVIDGLSRSLTLSGANTTRGIAIIQDSARITIQNAKLKNTTNPNATTGTCFTMQSQVKAASTDIKLINNEIGNCGTNIGSGHGIYLSYCTNCLIERNEIHGAVDMGIHNYNSGGYFINHNNLIRYNHIYNNGSAGILIGSGRNTIAHHNIVRDNGGLNSAGGIRIGYTSPTNIQVYNNTVYANRGPCLYVKVDSVETKAKNNFCLSNSANAIENYGASTVSANNRLTIDSTLVVDPKTAQFSPREGSVLIDAGENIPGFSSGKFLGASPDQGALEFVPKGTVTPPNPTSLQVFAN